MKVFTVTEHYVEVIVEGQLIRVEVYLQGGIKHCQIHGSVYEVRRIS